MRIVAGSARGRRILAPDGMTTRPITDRAKEGIFNMLLSITGIEAGMNGMVVHDLFAGSGSFGLECLSRGAANVTFVERNRQAANVIQKNLDTFGFADRATVLMTTVEAIISTLGHADVVFCDPPYPDDPWTALLQSVDADLLVGHAERPVQLSDGWTEVKRRKYGRSQIVIAERADAAKRPGTDL
ncbi:MAG: RsmD family RNA methyltransferase [Acidimicrobiales bacterium]